MKNRENLSLRVGHSLVTIGFFVFIFMWIWKKVQTDLIYHSFGSFLNYPIFLFEWDFFLKTATYPGGITSIVSGFCSQLYYYPMAGAAVITLISVLLYFSTKSILGLFNKRCSEGLAYIPVCLMLMTYRMYDHPLEIFIAILLCLNLTRIFLAIPYFNLPAHVILFNIIYLAGYYVAGGNALLILLLVSIYELKKKQTRLTTIITVPTTVALQALIGIYLLGMDPRKCFSILTVFDYQATAWWSDLGVDFVRYLTFFSPPLP